MLLKIAAVLAAVPMTLLAAVGATGLVVVDVKPSDGPHLVIPVPLLLAETAVRLAPEKASHVRMDEKLDRARAYLPVALEALDALAAAPDAELVSVDEDEQHVRISKAGDMLLVRVEGPGQNVTVNVPLSLAREAVRQVGTGHVSAGDLVGMLRQARLTSLVDVQDGKDHVKISVW